MLSPYDYITLALLELIFAVLKPCVLKRIDQAVVVLILCEMCEWVESSSEPFSGVKCSVCVSRHYLDLGWREIHI
jgi:hypothetical protein